MNEVLKISSIVIAKNEGQNIERCLSSQLDVIDDIVVVVDSSTTDNTLQIVQSFKNVNWYQSEWKGFVGSKNFALSKTKHNWVLWIDADEELTSELIGELKQFKLQEPKYKAYRLARRAFFLGKWIKHSGWYPSRATRLFNKNFVSFNNNNIHEQLRVNGEIGYLKNDINHYTDPTIEHYFTKFNSYTSLAAQDLFSRGKNAGLIDILIRPIFLFCKMYIFRLGFLDGLHGFVLAIFSSAYVFTKYCKLWELNRKNQK